MSGSLPSGPAYTVVLICHVTAVLTGLVAVVTSAVAAAGLLASQGSGGRPLPPFVRTYFAPGVNWTGRVLYLVPVFGVVLVKLSGGVYPLDATWVLCGIGLWVAAMVVGEAALWPAERRVKRALVASPAAPATTGEVPAEAFAACRVVCVSAAGLVVILLTAAVVMFAKP